MKCPSCSAAANDEAAECPSCGLIFAKWRDRQAKEKKVAVEALETLETAPAGPLVAMDQKKLRIAAGAVVGLWIGALALYYAFHMPKGHAPKGEPTGEYAEMRDPKTGEMRRMPIRRVEGR